MSEGSEKLPSLMKMSLKREKKKKKEQKQNFYVTVEGKICWQAALLGYAIVFKEKWFEVFSFETYKVSGNRKLKIIL